MIRIKNYRYGIYPINIVNITPSPIKSVIPTTTSTIKSEFGFDVQLRTWLTNKKNIVNIYKILDDAIDYCHEHSGKFIADMNDRGFEGGKEFNGLMDILESGNISPLDLADYGMDY